MTDPLLTGNRSHLALMPCVIQNDVNEAIEVFKGQALLQSQSAASLESLEILTSFGADIRAAFRVANPTTEISGEVTVHPDGWDAPAQGYATTHGFTIGKSVVIHPTSGFVQDLLSIGTREPLGRVRFHLLNFEEYFGETITKVDGTLRSDWRGRVTFDMGPWTVTLDAVRDVSKKIRKAKEMGGYIITHVGNLAMREERNGISKLFNAKQALRALEILYYVFGFANGARCQCFLPYGYRFMPTEVARWVHVWSNHRAGYGQSWFVREKPAACFEFASELYSLYKDDFERSWITSAISLYIESNRNTAGVDIELSKSQIALELLAWEACQERLQLVSRESFERLPAVDKIRMALAWAGIPTSIPDTMSELRQGLNILAEGEPTPHDGPLAVTQVRNSTIHMTRNRRARMAKLDPSARYQAWMLSQGYVELLLLRLLKYSGPYCPRYDIAGGRPWAQVPWSS